MEVKYMRIKDKSSIDISPENNISINETEEKNTKDQSIDSNFHNSTSQPGNAAGNSENIRKKMKQAEMSINGSLLRNQLKERPSVALADINILVLFSKGKGSTATTSRTISGRPDGDDHQP